MTDSFDDLTLRQQSVFGFIVAYKRDHDGNSPSVREIMAACDYHSTGTMHYTLRRLAQIGVIELSGVRGTTRQIAVVGGAWTWTQPETISGDPQTKTI